MDGILGNLELLHLVGIVSRFTTFVHPCTTPVDITCMYIIVYIYILTVYKRSRYTTEN